MADAKFYNSERIRIELSRKTQDSPMSTWKFYITTAKPRYFHF